MKTEHTPGPYRIKYGTNVVAASGRVVALCATLSTNGPDEEQVMAENMANACLFAAAPDLLSELETAIAWIEDAGNYGAPTKDEVLPQLRAAVAKARGES